MSLSTANTTTAPATNAGGGFIPDDIAGNYDQAVREGSASYAGIAKFAADTGAPGLARWAADRASAAELRKAELTARTAEAQAQVNANGGTPPVPSTTPADALSDETRAAAAAAARNADSTKPITGEDVADAAKVVDAITKVEATQRTADPAAKTATTRGK